MDWILTPTQPGSLTADAWESAIKADDRLVQPTEVTKVPNPFNPGQDMEVKPNPLNVSVWVSGSKVGEVSWQESDHGNCLLASTEGAKSQMQGVLSDLETSLALTTSALE